jgi:hypothetical protein
MAQASFSFVVLFLYSSILQILIMWFNLQIGGDKTFVVEAQQHIVNAGDAIARAGESKALTRRFKEAKVSVAAIEVWAKACEAGEVALQKGKEALIAGDLAGASGHCQELRLILDGGVKCQSLRGALNDLEHAVNAGA